jgi:DNA-binding beta-propeller fold protein YncE
MPFFLAAAMLMSGFLPDHAQTKWAVTKTVHVGGEGGWDYILVDGRKSRLFVTRNTYTEVISTTTGKVIANISGQIRSHGTAIVPDVNRGFITDGGGSGAIDVFDLTTYELLGKIHTMPDSDGIIYDHFENLILAVSGDEGKLMTFRPDIDITEGKFNTIDLGGAPEYLAADENGKVYVNLADKNLVAVVDLKTNKVVARWPVAPGGVPEGMAIDQRDHVLFIGCRNPQKLIVMDTRTGKVLAALPIGSLVDATRYTAGQAFASCGGTGELFVASRKGGIWQLDQVVKTAMGARTMDIDRQTQTIFLPTAKLGPPLPGERDHHIEAGTFMLVEVGRH